jgi:uncharacterized protein YeaO (DUF488 family)
MTGTVDETYVAALQHDLVEPGEATLVGVVRRPTGWFRAAVDENVPVLGPPRDLLEEAKARTEALKRDGLCDEGAHNAAWAELDFERRYRDHLDADGAAALDDLADRLRGGEDLWLVCFEGDGKRCHRRPLVELLRDRV